MTVSEKAAQIIADIQQEKGIDPGMIFQRMVQHDYINMHGPEHHILDGACLLTAYRNAGGVIDLEAALQKLAAEGLRMPGAMCGLWGICGAIASVGAALAIIDGTGPLTADGTWGKHMAFTAAASAELGRINGPRCCKRDGMVALMQGVAYVNAHYPVHLETEGMTCMFSPVNQQCIGARCPFHPKG